MRNSIIILITGMLICLCLGCAKYTHPTRNADHWDNDYAMCVTEADYQVDFHPYTTDVAHPDESRLMTYSDRYWGMIRSCMELKGYAYEEEDTWMDSLKKSVQSK